MAPHHRFRLVPNEVGGSVKFGLSKLCIWNMGRFYKVLGFWGLIVGKPPKCVSAAGADKFALKSEYPFLDVGARGENEIMLYI